jgi:hypothetical protein
MQAARVEPAIIEDSQSQADRQTDKQQTKKVDDKQANINGRTSRQIDMYVDRLTDSLRNR